MAALDECTTPPAPPPPPPLSKGALSRFPEPPPPPPPATTKTSTFLTPLAVNVPEPVKVWIVNPPLVVVKQEPEQVPENTTTRLNIVVLPSGVPVTVIGKVPSGVEAEVVRVRVLAQVGLQGLEVKLAVVPEGNPETDRETGSGVPEVRLLVIVFEPAEP